MNISLNFLANIHSEFITEITLPVIQDQSSNLIDSCLQNAPEPISNDLLLQTTNFKTQLIDTVKEAAPIDSTLHVPDLGMCRNVV